MYRTLTHLILSVGLLCVATGPGYSAALVGYWPFDGDAQDASGNNNHGTAFGDVSYGAGMQGQAAQFDGSGDYVQVPNNPGIQLLSGTGFAVAAYVNTPSSGHQNILIHGLGCSTWASWFLGVEGGEPDAVLSPGNFVFGVRSSNGSAYTAAIGEVVIDEWVHLAAAHDGSTLTLYVNGQEQNRMAAPRPFNSGESLYIGGDPGCNGRSWYTGQVDELYIFNRPLNANQLEDLASGIVPTFLKAENPDPADGTVGLAAPLLRWTKGLTAIFHNVYLGTTPDLGPEQLVAPRYGLTTYYHTGMLQPGATYYWRVDEVEADGVTIHTGDVWTFVTQDLTAYHPDPADGATDASPTPTLTWMPGQAAVKHHLYFSDNLDAVTQGTAEADKGELTVDKTTFFPGDLGTVSTYYWRVDETLLGGTVRTGPVWTFTTYLPVDDFESYNDEADRDTRIYETWIDGWVNNNGMTVGYTEPPFAELKIVHGGLQSMPLDYNNIPEPFYSEAEREFSPAADWTINDVNTLVLYVRGRTTNSPTQLYVRLEDSSQHSATVVHPDPNLVAKAKWVEWKVPLGEFAGVNMARVRTMCLGLGDRNDPEPDGAGLIYIDDIRVIK